MSEELLQYKVLKPISFKGDRIEKDSIIHMTPEEAKNIGDEFLQLVEKINNEEEIPADSTEPKKPEESEDGGETETKEDEKSSEENTDNTQTDTNIDENL